MPEQTIAAIATPSGSGGIGIVRLSGTEAFMIVEKLFRPYAGKSINKLLGYSGMLGTVTDGDVVIDEAILFIYRAPKSYTGEDVAEISCHGGVWVVERVLRLCLESGAEMAEAGEFTKRAFLNGKMDLTKAEAIMDIISAQGDAALLAANAAREGALSTATGKIVEKLLEQSAHLAAWSDYPEEDMQDVEPPVLLSALRTATADIEKLLFTFDSGKILREGVETVIVGKPNVGKSTLMNLLSGEERSIVTEIAGTTRDIVKSSVRLGGIVLQLSDTAGIRDTNNIIEQIGVDRAKAQMENAQLVLAVFDGSSVLDEQDKVLLSLIEGKNSIAVLNKADLPCKMDMDFIKARFSHLVSVSAKTGAGREELERLVLDITRIKHMDMSAAIVATERQRRHLLDAKTCIDEAAAAVESGMTLDAANVCLDGALEALLSLTGERAGDRVIDEVFKRFCVGK